MNARRTLLATTFVLTATVVSNTAAANTLTAQKPFASTVQHYIDIASAEVTDELKREIEKDILTASHHATPAIDSSVLLASVNVTDIKKED
jgi:hypothetical protein